MGATGLPRCWGFFTYIVMNLDEKTHMDTHELLQTVKPRIRPFLVCLTATLSIEYKGLRFYFLEKELTEIRQIGRDTRNKGAYAATEAGSSGGGRSSSRSRRQQAVGRARYRLELLKRAKLIVTGSDKQGEILGRKAGSSEPKIKT